MATRKDAEKDAQGVRKLDDMHLEGEAVSLEKHEASFSEASFELNRDSFIFPLAVEDAGQEHVLFAHMRPYTHAEGIELFDAMGIKFRFEGREKLITKSALNEKVRPFFWKHFVKLEGLGKLVWLDGGKDLTDGEVEDYLMDKVDPALVEEKEQDLDSQTTYIKDNPAKRIEEASVMQGYGNFNIDVISARKTSRLVIGGRSQNVIVGHVFVYDPEHGNQKVKVRIGFKKDSEFNFRRYLAATGQSEMHRKSEEWQRVEDYHTILDIGKHEMLFAEGYTIKGEPCTGDNIKHWIDAFPFWHLQACVDDIYGRGATLKND